MPADPLSATFAALADPTRRAILARLSLGQASVTELAEPFDMTLPAVSKHLKVLERAGLIARGREAQWRPCRLAPAPLKNVADWVEGYRAFWERRFDRLDECLRTLQGSVENTEARTDGRSGPSPDTRSRSGAGRARHATRKASKTGAKHAGPAAARSRRRRARER